MRINKYKKATSFDEGDVLLKDGINGTQAIDFKDAIPSNSDLIAIRDEANNFAATTVEGALAESAGKILNLNSNLTEIENAEEQWISKVSPYTIGQNIVDFTSQGEAVYPWLEISKHSMTSKGTFNQLGWFDLPFENGKTYHIITSYTGFNNGIENANIKLYRDAQILFTLELSGNRVYTYTLVSTGTEKIRIYVPGVAHGIWKLNYLFVAQFSEQFSNLFSGQFNERLFEQLLFEQVECDYFDNTIDAEGHIKISAGYQYSSAIHLNQYDTISLKGNKTIYRTAIYAIDPTIGTTPLQGYVNNESTHYVATSECYVCLTWATGISGIDVPIIRNGVYRTKLIPTELDDIRDAANTLNASLSSHKTGVNPHGLSLNTFGIVNATPEASGLMSASDKSKLDNLINQGSITITGSGVYKNASAYGFLPTNDADTNSAALQDAVDGGGTIVVDLAGTYDVCKSCQLGSFTTLIFGNNVFLNRAYGVDEKTATYPFMNTGVLTGEYNEYISIIGLHLKANAIGMGTDVVNVYGQRGQLAFCNIKHLLIKDFTILDGDDDGNYNVHVQNFEDANFENIRIVSQKDGIHLGKGNGFSIKHCFFKTNDDAIALNEHDYPSGTSYLGWIENGVIEDIHFLSAPEMNAGRGLYMLGGSWLDWTSGMEIRTYGDAVVSDGRIYRTIGTIDALTTTISTDQPTHISGALTYGDGVKWLMAQDTGICYNCGVRNIVFRDVYAERSCNALLTFNFDNDPYSRSYYPGSIVPTFENITLENVTTLPGCANSIVWSIVPMKNIKIKNVNYNVNENALVLSGNYAGLDYGTATMLFDGLYFELTNDNKTLVNVINDRFCKLKFTNSLGNYDEIVPTKSGVNVTILSSDIGLT